ncbi:hypothetical protein ACHAXR_010492 [Thalassiosira sp. AJA248-18]
MAFLPAMVQSSRDAQSALLANDDHTNTPQTRQKTMIPDFFATTPNRRTQAATTTSAGAVYSTCPDLSYITGPMYESDVDGNGFLNKEEYVTFTNSISGGYLEEMGWDGRFTNMPLTLQESYLVVSCICELFPSIDGGGEGCCTTGGVIDNTGIRTDGSAPEETPTEAQEDYLTYVCGTMNNSLKKVGSPGVVAPPTGKPTDRPTQKPTPSPTVKPTPEPTKKPTVPPTLNPTKKPTLEPTKKPTNPPTNEPSKKPSMPPSQSPTPRPTPPPVAPGDPTQSPTTESPSKAPVIPTKPPTTAPITLSPVVPPTPGTPTNKPTPPPGSPTQSPVVAPPTKSPSPTTETKSPSGDVLDTLPPSKSPTTRPTQSPTASAEPTGQPTASPSETPSISAAPTDEPTSTPSIQPSISLKPTISSAPSIAPTISSAPTFTSAPTPAIFTGEVPASVDFVVNFNGEVNASEVMAGETNQVKLKMEESLLELSDIVIEEEFGATEMSTDETTTASPESTTPAAASGTGSSTSRSSNNEPMLRGRRRARGSRVLIVENATLATVNDVQDVGPAPNPGEKPTDPINTKPQPLSAGAIVGIIVGVLGCFLITFFFADRGGRRGAKDDDSSYMERRTSFKDDAAAQDKLDPSSPDDYMSPDDSWSAANTTADRSYNSQEPLMQGQQSSSMAQSPMRSALGSIHDSDNSDVDESIYSLNASADAMEPSEDDMSSPLAAMAAASTFVASSTPPPVTPKSSSPVMDIDNSSFGGASASDDWAMAAAASRGFSTEGAMGGSVGAASPPASAGYVAAGGGTTSPEGAAAVGANTAGGEGGLGAGAAAAIGAAGAGLVAAGAYAATRSSRGDSSKSVDSSKSSVDSVPSAMGDIDNAIESGNWGQVGALAAILASQGHGSPPSKGSKKNRSMANVSGSRSDDSGSRSLDQARAAEIDKLVESGDWQGVVLAAARFEADQTFDGGSYSGSASQSSRWTGSATSATTPRSMATTEQSASNISSQRGQEEIRAEVEALVRRVVPEEADNIDEMMTQFKGREEELVETLRRMQERAIASRARLAVQKSAKLEARAKASPRGSAQSVASQSSLRSEKSELEQAIEAGNWEAVGMAAQRMSDSSTAGDLSAEDKARLRDAISISPAFNRAAGNEDFNLDSLIEQGDWPGVIEAAKAASEGPDHTEEQEAMAQANMWQAIANQSKQGAGQGKRVIRTTLSANLHIISLTHLSFDLFSYFLGPAGAGDAAAWAIQRSLRALDSSADSSTAVRTINDIADEQDSDASAYESSSYDDSGDRQRGGI